MIWNWKFAKIHQKNLDTKHSKLEFANQFILWFSNPNQCYFHKSRNENPLWIIHVKLSHTYKKCIYINNFITPNLATLYYGCKNNLAKLLILTPSLSNYQIMCLTTSYEALEIFMLVTKKCLGPYTYNHLYLFYNTPC